MSLQGPLQETLLQLVLECIVSPLEREVTGPIWPLIQSNVWIDVDAAFYVK